MSVERMISEPLPKREYYWQVVVRQDRMGFTKRFVVPAPDALWAINEAGAELMARGYEKTFHLFNVIELVRLREVGT